MDKDPLPSWYTNPSQFSWKATDVPDLRAPTMEESMARKPASKVFEEQIRDSYYSANRQIERSKNAVEMAQLAAVRRKPLSDDIVLDDDDLPRSSRTYGSFRRLEEDSVFQPKTEGEYGASGITSSGVRAPYIPGVGYRTYAAPAVDDDDVAYTHSIPPRRYYSRITEGDPDYFDFDLNHSVEMFKKKTDPIQPRTPQYWEQKLLSDLGRGKGMKPIAPYMFVKDSAPSPPTGYLSAALRTPSFWSQRFENLIDRRELPPSVRIPSPSPLLRGESGFDTDDEDEDE